MLTFESSAVRGTTSIVEKLTVSSKSNEANEFFTNMLF